MILDSIGEWKSEDNGNIYVCNFDTEVLTIINVCNANGEEIESRVKLRLLFGSGYSDEFKVPLLDLSDVKWVKFDKRCRLNPKYSTKFVGRHIADEIISQLRGVKTEVRYKLGELGFHEINGVRVYRAGDHIIWSPGEENKIHIELEPLPQRFIIDTKRYSEEDAAGGMVKAVSLSPAGGRIILAQTIAGIIRSAFIEIGVIPDTVVQRIGTTGVLKTTYTSFMTQLYNRNRKPKPACRLNSTPAAITQILHENRDCCVVLDDIHPAESKEIMRKNESTLEEITRRVGDSMGKNRMYGNIQKELSPNGTVVVTGEYEHGRGSTAARTLVEDYLELIDSTEFHKLQQEPLIVSTFYYYFIGWVLEHWDELKELLSQWLTPYRSAVLCEHKRLQETHFYLNASYAIFIQYC